MILSHYFRFQPDTHGVIRSHYHGVTYTRYTLYFRDNVDFGIVFKKFIVVLVVRTVEREDKQHTGLPFRGDNTYLGNLCREETLSFGNTVLHVNGSHIRVGSLFKVNFNGGISGVGCRRSHVHHVLHTIDLLLKWSNHTVQYSLCIGSLISCTDAYSRRCDVRILGDRQ